MERGFEIALDGRPEEVELSKVIEITKEVDLPSDYTVLDFETTGFKPETSKIIQVGAIRYRNDEKSRSSHRSSMWMRSQKKLRS